MKMRTLATAAALLLGVPGGALAAPSKNVELTWFGHSAVLIKSPKGKTLMLDPFPPSIGYKALPKMKVDGIAITHEHDDHNYVGFAQGKPKIVRAITTDKPWKHQVVDEKIGDFKIRSVGGTYHSDAEHDGVRGPSGPNGIFVIEVAGLKIVHLGDLGEDLKEETVKAIGPVDVLLIAVGSKFTLGGPRAYKVKQQLDPKVAVLPIHYKTDQVRLPLETDYNDFIAGRTGVVRPATNKYVIDPKKLPDKPQIVILDFHDPADVKKMREEYRKLDDKSKAKAAKADAKDAKDKDKKDPPAPAKPE